MRVSGVPNKFEVFQAYYYDVNGVNITYNEALRLYLEMDDKTFAAFEQYYQDETGYEIVTGQGYKKPEEKNANKFNKGYVYISGTIEAYANAHDIVLDPIWAQYSAKEIIQMEGEGVVIPQEVLDLAHTIYDEQAAKEAIESEDESNDTAEKEPYLDLIPKAAKKIKKCNENNEKMEDAIEALLPKHAGKTKSFSKKAQDQKSSLEEFEKIVREWRVLQNKVNNGEALSDSESRKYARLTGMLSDKKPKNNGIMFDKREIAKSLNEINILAVLGEKLADETIEISDDLADYTSNANYKTTRNDVMLQIGFLGAIIAMAKGKNLAIEANKIGNETKEYTEETKQSSADIASVMEIEGMVSSPDSLSAEMDVENQADTTDETKAEESVTVEEVQIQAGENDKQETENTQEEVTPDEDFIITNESVLKLIKETGDINTDLMKQLREAVSSIKYAKEDKRFAKVANRRIDKLIEKYRAEEEARQQEVQQLDSENKESEKEIENITGQPAEESQEGTKAPSKDKDEENDSEDDKVEASKTKISNNNKKIETIKGISEEAREEFKVETAKEKDKLTTSLPQEVKAQELHTEQSEEILPQERERLDFIGNSGLTLARMGKAVIELGLAEITAGTPLFPALITKGIYDVTRGTLSAFIGSTAMLGRVSSEPAMLIAEKSTDLTLDEIADALEGLVSLDDKIASVTGESTEVSTGDGEEEGADNAEGTEETEFSENSDTTGENTTEISAETSETTTQEEAVATVNEAFSDETSGPSKAPANSPAKRLPKSPEEITDSPNPVASAKFAANNISDIESIRNSNKGAYKSSASTDSNSSAKKSSGKKDEMSTDQAGKNVSKIGSSAKDDSKDSENTKKDTDKTTKQLEKETKNIEKQMKRDAKEIAKMTKESLKAAKKQSELLVEYEALVEENEVLIAEESAKQQKSEGGVVKDKDAQNAGGVLAAAAFVTGAGANNTENTGSVSETQAKIDNNGARINELGIQFKTYGKKIDRNRTKIQKIQKTTKKNSKRLNAKFKTIDAKNKEAAKKEQAKQKKLAKQLAVVGVAKNIFSITLSTGTLMMLFPPTASAGAILVDIGTYGLLACTITEAAIQLANGNGMAALISVGMAVVQIASSFIPGAGAATTTVLQGVSAGLSIVSSSTEMVNNVRAIQGKEANETLGKISAIAGMASAVTGAASSINGISGEAGKQVGTFGKITNITNVVGTALSTTSQIWGMLDEDSKTAQIIAMAGAGVSLAASAMQLGASFSNAEQKNNDNNQSNNENKNPETPSSNTPSETPKSENQSGNQKTGNPESSTPEKKDIPKTENSTEKKDQTDNADKKETPETTSDKKEPAQGKEEAEQKTEKVAKDAEKDAIGSIQGEIQELLGGTVSAGTPETLAEVNSAIDQEAAQMGEQQAQLDTQNQDNEAQNTQNKEAKKPGKLEKLFKKLNGFTEKAQPYMQIAGQAASLASGIYALTQDSDTQDDNHNILAGRLTERTKKIIRKNRRRVNALANHGKKRYA